MRTHIEGGWVVAWNGRATRSTSRGAWCSRTTASCTRAPAYTGPADARIAARGKLVSPGFINTHVHTAGNGGDYLLLDMAKNDYRTAELHGLRGAAQGQDDAAAGRGHRGRSAPSSSCTRSRTAPPPSSTWAACAGTGTATRGWSTTSACASTASPPFRDRDTFMDAQGRLTYEEDAAVGRERLEEAVDFVQASTGPRRAGCAACLTRPRSRRAASRCCGRARTRRASSACPSTPTPAATSSSSSASWTSTARRRSSSSPTSASSTSAPCIGHGSSPPRTRGRAIRSATTCASSPSAAPPSATARTSTPRWP